MAIKDIRGPVKPGYRPTRIFIADSNIGLDAFESSRGAARFILGNVGSGYIAHVTFGRHMEMFNWLDRTRKQLKITDISAVDFSGEDITRHRFKLIGIFAKLFREYDEVGFHIAHVPVQTKNWKGDDQTKVMTISIEVKRADYFKGKQYPSYVDRKAAKETMEQDREIDRLDREAYRRAERVQLLRDATIIDREELDKMTGEEIDSLWEEMEMDDHLAELERDAEHGDA